MCARRFLFAVVILTLLAVAGAFAIFEFGDRVLVRSTIPKGHFEPSKAGSGPDYTAMDAWLARPGLQRPDDPADWKPAGAPLPDSGERPAAMFYIHPTTYLQNDRWNAPASGVPDSDFRDLLFVQSQASAFNDVAQIWAPRYRQAAYGAFLLKSEDAQQALDFAYRDVAAAFDRFVEETGDRPIILAGHSQGALHLERLLREKVAGRPIAKRIVAAYVVGWPISITADLSALGMPACAAPAEPGCILSWMSFADPPNADLILDQWTKVVGLNGGKRRADEVLCVNPISGTSGGAAPPQANPGTLIPSADMKSAILLAGAVGAHCDKGLLILDGKVPAMGPFVLPGNNYHVYDYALYWGAIRQDIARRLAVWRR
jgi:hypothetical protein